MINMTVLYRHIVSYYILINFIIYPSIFQHAANNCPACSIIFQHFINHIAASFPQFTSYLPTFSIIFQHLPSIFLAFCRIFPGPKVPYSTARAPSMRPLPPSSRSSRRGSARPRSSWIQRRYSRSCASRGTSWRTSDNLTGGFYG